MLHRHILPGTTILTALIFIIELVHSQENNATTVIEKADLLAASDFFWKQQAHSSSLLELLRYKQDTKSYSKLIDAMTKLGPIFMVASTGLVFLSILGDTPKSVEFTMIQEGYQRIDASLALLNSQIEESNFLISYKAAQSVYQRDANAIYNLYEEFLNQRKTDKFKENYVKSYEAIYHYAAKNIWRYIVSGDPVDINLLDAYRDFVKCHPLRIQAFCLRMIDRINKGQAVEGYYYALTNDWDSLKYAESHWKQDMELVKERCDAVVSQCDNEWKVYATRIFEDVTNKHLDVSNQNLAAKLYEALSTGIPHRMWSVWVFDGKTKLNAYHLRSMDGNTIWWYKNDKIILAVTLPLDNAPFQLNTAKTAMTQFFSRFKINCRFQIAPFGMHSWMGPFMRTGTLPKDVLSFIANKSALRSEPHTKNAMFVITSSSNVAVQHNPLRLFEHEFHDSCIVYPVKFYLFQ